MRVYRDYDQAGLDAQYNNRERVPDFLDSLERGVRASEAVRARLSCALDLAYGPGPRDRLDIFPASHAGAPVHVFMHGGYWRAMDKEMFSYPAAAFVQAGITFVAMTYPLAPAVGMDQIVASMRAALAWMCRNAAQHGGDPARITVSGHSAGGHLAAMALATDWARWDGGGGPVPADLVKAACAISGLYDLEPIRLSYLNADLHLDAASAHRNSPVHAIPARAGPLVLAVGGLESEEYHRQQSAFAEPWTDAGLAVDTLVLPGLDHFTVLEQLGDPESPLFQAVLVQIFGDLTAPGVSRTF